MAIEILTDSAQRNRVTRVFITQQIKIESVVDLFSWHIILATHVRFLHYHLSLYLNSFELPFGVFIFNFNKI